MSKKKQKRNKHYKGSSAQQQPQVLRVSAVKRNPAHQWWVDHQRLARPIGIAALVVIVIILVIIGIIGLVSR